MMALAYNNRQNGVLQVHRPEICYPAGGFELSPTRKIDLHVGGRIIPANFFTATSPNRIEQVEYFTRLGRAFPRSWAEQRLAVVEANLKGNIPDGMLMRVSLLGNDPVLAQQILGEFSRQFIQIAPPLLKRILVGTST